MSFALPRQENFPPPDWNRPFAALRAAAADAGFDPPILQADPAEVRFEADMQSVRIGEETTQHRRTRFEASAEIAVGAPGGHAQAPTTARYRVDMPATAATPEAMRAINPFDPDTLPAGATVRLDGGDYAGTPFEAAFAEIARANEVPLDRLALTIGRTREGEIRVMSGPASIFDAPTEHGPASQPLDREDFSQHTVLFDDPGSRDQRAAFNALLLTGTQPDAAVALREDVSAGRVDATITEVGSGETNEVTWTFDAEGRPTGAEATLTWEPSSAGRDSDTVENAAQSQFRTDHGLKGSGDHVGHMLAYRFVNGHGPINMFPQQGGFNTGPYARIEQEWADWLAQGMEVRLSIELAPEGQQRPDQVRLDYEVIDPDRQAIVYDPALTVFDNEAGQVYQRIARNDMPGMIENAS